MLDFVKCLNSQEESPNGVFREKKDEEEEEEWKRRKKHNAGGGCDGNADVGSSCGCCV